MPCQLPADCLIEIFEYYSYGGSLTTFQQSENESTLRSCLLVNRLWSQTCVRILWNKVQSYNTLISCLPGHSREILHKNGIIVSTPTPKPLLFDYLNFVKILSINRLVVGIETFLTNHERPASESLVNDKIVLLGREVFKMIMSQTTLRTMDCPSTTYGQDIPFLTYPGAVNCLTTLSELKCDSDIPPEFFHQLSQICRGIESLTIIVRMSISEGLPNLIAGQRKLKDLSVRNCWNGGNTSAIIPSITKHSKGLIKCFIHEAEPYPWIMVSKLRNLQELVLSVQHHVDEYFETLKRVTFPHLRTLHFLKKCPRSEHLNAFLEKNGKNLEEILLRGDRSTNLSIAGTCPNLKSLYTVFRNEEMEAFKVVLRACQRLETVGCRVGGIYPNEIELLEVIAKDSPRSFRQLKMGWFGNGQARTELFVHGFERVLIGWSNRFPQKMLSLTVVNNFSELNIDRKNIQVIEKYRRLGIIGKFEFLKACSVI